MSCPTCQHTMHNLGINSQRIFWCPRCGTIKSESGDFDNVSAPKLVGYIQKAEELSIRTSVDGCSIQYAVPSWFWRAAVEAVGLKPHP